MYTGKLAAIAIAFVGLACLAMAPLPAPSADAQAAGDPAATPKTSATREPAADHPSPPPAPKRVPAAETKQVALEAGRTKNFPNLDQVVDQVTQKLQSRIDRDAKQIEQTLMRQSSFHLGP